MPCMWPSEDSLQALVLAFPSCLRWSLYCCISYVSWLTWSSTRLPFLYSVLGLWRLALPGPAFMEVLGIQTQVVRLKHQVLLPREPSLHLPECLSFLPLSQFYWVVYRCSLREDYSASQCTGWHFGADYLPVERSDCLIHLWVFRSTLCLYSPFMMIQNTSRWCQMPLGGKSLQENHCFKQINLSKDQALWLESLGTFTVFQSLRVGQECLCMQDCPLLDGPWRFGQDPVGELTNHKQICVFTYH